MSALIEVNTDGLAKLTQTIGNWLGLEARAIERNAEAEAYAAVRKVDAENTATLIRLQGEEQVANYILAREKRKMNNVQKVIEQAQQHFVEGEQVSDEPVAPDWLNCFFSIVENVSDEDIQKRWAHVLAGEVKRPKSYSLRTLELLKNINKEDAIDIQNASKFHIDSSVFCVELFGADILMRSRMDELGIICGGEMLYIVVTTFDEPRNIIVGAKYCIRIHSKKQIQIPIKSYRLTTVGKDIFSMANVDNAKFAIRLANHLNREGVDKVELFKIIKYDGEKYTLSTEDLFCKYQDLAKYENELE